MGRPLIIYDFATAPFWISLNMRKIWFPFLSVYSKNGWDLAEWLERLTANAPVATVLGSIPASVGTVESEGRQMKQCWILYEQKDKKSPPKKILKKNSKNKILLQSRAYYSEYKYLNYIILTKNIFLSEYKIIYYSKGDIFLLKKKYLY